jgi:hypothetical protein
VGVKTDYIVVRRCPSAGYELVDVEGRYVGCAPTFANLMRFVLETAATVEFDLPLNEVLVHSEGSSGPPGPLSSKATPAARPGRGGESSAPEPVAGYRQGRRER